MQSRYTATPISSDRITPLMLSNRELESYSLLRAIDASKAGNWRSDPFLREVSLEIAKRAGLPEPSPHTLYCPPQILAPQQRDLTVANAPGGGFTVATEVVGVVDALRELLRVNRLGAQRLTGLRSNVSYARQGTKTSVTWAPTEGTPAAETADFGFGQIVLAPKTVSVYTEISRALRLMSADLAEFSLRREFAATLATTLDSVALAGTGSGGQPMGLTGTAGIGAFTGASIAYAGLLEAQTDILNANALGSTGEVGFLCRPAVASLLANRQGFSTLVPMWTGPLAAGQLIGCPSFSSMNAPASTLIAGDWSQLLLAEWGAGLEIRVNPIAGFQSGITGFSATLSVDVAVLQPLSFSVASSVT